jgi:hypothetical protein
MGPLVLVFYEHFDFIHYRNCSILNHGLELIEMYLIQKATCNAFIRTLPPFEYLGIREQAGPEGYKVYPLISAVCLRRDKRRALAEKHRKTK